MSVLLLLALTGCASDLGVSYRGRVLTAVDMHLHAGDWEKIPPSTQELLAENFPFPFSLNPPAVAARSLRADAIVDQLDSGGLKRGVLLAVYAPHSVGLAPNDFVAEQQATAPDRLSALASLRVDRWVTESAAQLEALDETLALPGMIGVKLAHTHMHFRMDDPDYYGIYDVAEAHDAPIYLHTGSSPFPGTDPSPPYTDPAYMEDAIRSYPDVDFILGHIGFDFIHKTLGELETCIQLAEQYPNVYLEPSAMGSAGSDPEGENLVEAMRRFREAGLIDRIIHGSDGPQFPGFVGDYLDRVVTAMEAADYTADEAELVLSGNFERVFGVTP